MLGSLGQLGSNFILEFKKRNYNFDIKNSNSNFFLIDNKSKSGHSGSKFIDIAIKESLEEIISKLKPNVVINCCAATNVDMIEEFPMKGVKSNIIGVLNINEICGKLGIKQIYFSTEAAYDGSQKSSYFESDDVNPKSKYALSKVIADQIVLNSTSQGWIFRTSWLYSLNSKSSFVSRILEKSRSSNTPIGVTDDLFGNPTPAWWLANTIINIIEDLDHLPIGLYHLCSSGVVSKFDWAKKILSDLIPEKASLLVPTKQSDYPNANLRSPYVDLNTKKIQISLKNIQIEPWEQLWFSTAEQRGNFSNI